MKQQKEIKDNRSKAEKEAIKKKNQKAKALCVVPRVCAGSGWQHRSFTRRAPAYRRVRVARTSHMYAFVDGHIEKLANCMVEPPNLFRGRGEHPKTGTYKRRVMPEDVRPAGACVLAVHAQATLTGRSLFACPWRAGWCARRRRSPSTCRRTPSYRLARCLAMRGSTFSTTRR